MRGQDLDAIIRGVVGGVRAGGVRAEGVRADGVRADGVRTGGLRPAAGRQDDVPPPDRVRRVAIGADHGGFESKEALKAYLQSLGYHVTDVGTHGKESVDYPDFAVKVARKVAGGECERGIMIDGAGIGSSMVCNKVRGVRAALCYDLKTVVNSREHNNANVLTLGGPLHPIGDLCQMAKVWLETRFAGGRHWPRINKMMAVERGDFGESR